MTRKIRANVTLTIDGREVTVPEGTNMIEAARAVGIHIPHYCYHPSMSIAGSCRMCFVEIEGKPKMALGCETAVAPGMIVHTQTPQVLDARRGMLEFFLINHPLDCPECDRGGECYLQWYSMDHGSGFCRTIEPRRRLRKPNIDPLIDLERNRCVYCSRCVRFLQEIGGERIIGTLSRGDRSHIGTFEYGPIRSIFSGMIIDYCPVGTLTNRPYRFKARPWELAQVQSVCPYCSSGCPVTLWMRGGKIYRVTPQTTPQRGRFHLDWDSRDVICNQGRFGCDFVGWDNRLKGPRVRREGKLTEVSWDEALEEVAHRLTEIRKRYGADAIGFIASSRATCEEMYLLQRLAREVVGTNNVDWRTAFVDGPAAQAASIALSRSTGNINDLEAYDVILVVNADIHLQTPVVSLKLKEAARLGLAKVYYLHYILDNWISRYARGVLHYAPEDTERVLEAIEQRNAAGLREALLNGDAAAADLLESLRTARNGLIVFGLDACSGLFAAPWLWRLQQLAASLGNRWEFLPVTAARNATGAFVVGCQSDRAAGAWIDEPAARTGQRWGIVPPDHAGLSAPEMIEAARKGRLKALYVLGGDDFAAHPWLDSIRPVLERLDMLVVQDVFETPLSERADAVLSGSFFSEKAGTLLDVSGWPSGRFAQGWQRPVEVQDDAVILDVLARKMGRNFGYANGNAVFEEMMRAVNPVCPLRAGELCLQGPGSEMPMRCRHYADAEARFQPQKFYTVLPTYKPSCRLTPGAQPRALEQAPERGDVGTARPELRLVWSPILFGRDELGDRSGIMGPLRDPPWIKVHPDDAKRLGMAEGDTVALESEEFTAGHALVRYWAGLAPGLVYAPQNLIDLRFTKPPRWLPELTLRKAPPLPNVGEDLVTAVHSFVDEYGKRVSYG